jgi:hypothetical protein
MFKGGVSNADRSMGTSRAKRDAKVAARRGLRSTDKATKMEIESAVKKQANQTAIKRANQQSAQPNTKRNDNKLTPKERVQAKKQQREIRDAGVKAAKEEHTTLKPTQKQIKAARKAMIEAGYQFPPKHQISVVPLPVKKIAAGTNSTTGNQSNKKKQQPFTKEGQGKQQQEPKNNNNNNNKRGGGKKK